MDTSSLIKDIILLVMGGLVTYFVTLAINKTQTPKPSLSWRLLPPVFFPSEDISSFNLVIENNGNKDAENVRVVIGFPKETTIASFELQVSEKAAKYEVIRSNNEIVVAFPFFYKKLECVLALLAKSLDPSDIEISVVGNNVKGVEKQSEYTEENLRAKRYARIASVALVGLTGAYALIVGYMYLMSLAATNYNQQIDIAKIYFDAGKPELAINVLEDIAHYWWVPSSKQVNYMLASAYASQNDAQSAIFYLHRVANQDSGIIQLVKTDKSFDAIRTSTDYIKFLRSSVKITSAL